MSLFSHYFQTELAYFRDLVQEFAQSHPEVAHMVLEGGDASVERLLQGAALLTSRLRLRAEDDFPEIIGVLFEQMWPRYIRPLPAATMMQFVPRGTSLRKSHALPAGIHVKGQPLAVDSGPPVECVFRTASPVQLRPIEVVDVKLDPAHPADWLLRVGFRMLGGASFDVAGLESLTLHLLGEEITRYSLYLWLVRHAHRVTVRNAEDTVCLSLSPRAIRPLGLDPQDALGSALPPPFHRVQLMQDYLAFPDKFLGLEVSGLDKVPRGALQTSFELVFHLGRPTDRAGQPTDIDLDVDATNLAVGCAPALNVSELDHVDIPVARGTNTFVLPVPRAGEVFEVEQVSGYDERTGQWIDYQAFFSAAFRHLDYGRPCYHLVRRGDGVHGLQTQLAITDPDGRPMTPPTDQLRVALTHTEGPLPLRLQKGQITGRTQSSPDLAAFRNVTSVSPPKPLEIGGERSWRVLAMLCMHPDDLASVNGLTQLLTHAGGQNVRGQQPRILKAESEVSGRVHRRTLVPMRQVRIDVGQEEFCCEGELYLFANVLRSLFAAGANPRTPCQVTVRGMPSRVEYKFPPL